MAGALAKTLQKVVADYSPKEERSLSGCSESRHGLLVSRPREQADTVSAGLRALGAGVYKIPFIEIRPPRSFNALDESLRLLANMNGLF